MTRDEKLSNILSDFHDFILQIKEIDIDDYNKAIDNAIKDTISQINQLFSEGKEKVMNKNYPLGEFDAVKWAKEFMRIYNNKKLAPQNHPDSLFPQEDDMRAWFANAIMTGYDIGYRKGYRQDTAKVDSNKMVGKDKEIEKAIAIAKQEIEYTKNYLEIPAMAVHHQNRWEKTIFALQTLIDFVERKI